MAPAPPLDLTCHSSPLWLWENFQGKDYKGQVHRDVKRPYTVFGSDLATEFLCGDGDVWDQHGNVRALVPAVGCPKPSWARTCYAGEHEGDEFWHVVAFEIGDIPVIGTVWEKHQSNELAAIAPVAPFRIVGDGSTLKFCIGTGEAVSSGWKTWYQNLPIGQESPGLHYLIVHIKYVKGPGGIIEVHHIPPGSKTPELVVDGSKLNLSSGTAPWTNLGGMAGMVQMLYSEIGAYTAGNPGRPRDKNYIWHWGEMRCNSWAQAMEVIGQPGPAAMWEISRDNNASPPTITLGYVPVANAYGYRYFADGKAVSTSFDPRKATVKFKQGSAQYGVLPLVSGDLITYSP